ncbi:MAG: phosphonate metabolism protein/1,5-bisphosphokinase (PRPP-forming) PhnN [Paracoccaceae bacterium]|jgi:ribose 1,5-bisphosphokinase|nr:phosphonate metabolism protein/1,5-bisphosphokinase (PRPP-forming) PhnN [Paracoccaceae bacterium]MDM7971394.1 phosphonate metabolism protein/1,5-bisphosphokinase (PRPP-forming) PhnN [Paracoccaceae bacterium]
MTGRLVAVVGPSGAGKDTLLAGAVAQRPGLVWARRVITRPEEAGGEPFEGVSLVEFEARKARGAFALHWVAHGLSYGIPASVLRQMQAGRVVLFNGSRAVLPRAKALFPDLAVILITADRAALRTRLAVRGRESGADLDHRLARADFALPEGTAHDVVDNSGAVEAGVQALVAVLDRLSAGPRG